MAFLKLENVTKSFGAGKNRTCVLNGLNLEINEGEFVAIVGFSGSGKTTLINLLAGLETPDQGRVLKNDQPIAGPGPDRGIVFQSYSLLPWLSVYQNVALAVNQVFGHWSKAERHQHILKYIEMVGLTAAKEKRPAELSGGMRQRVSVARALCTSPDVLLLDEPLSALDALTRSKLQDEIERIWSTDKKTVLLITNDVDEALLLADRIIPLNPGPNATLGPNFEVNIPRSRDRQAMNHNQTFIQLRAKITEYLIQVRAENSKQTVETIQLPAIKPKVFGKTTRLSPALDKEYLEYTGLVKTYPTPKGPFTVVDGFDLKVRKGEFISIIGHSGCGKSTVLTMTAGLNSVTSGGVILDGKEITTAGPDKGVVFQAPSLFPWLTAFQNVELGVDRVYPMAKRQERRDLIEYYLERVGLKDSMHKKAADLSNGMKQRVGIARAFALSPKLLLLDEPFGMLDSLTRWDLQTVLTEVWNRTKVTALLVTHDVDEAILMADRVVMMTNGPKAKIGEVLTIDLPRPRTRKQLLDNPKFYQYREHLIQFLENCDKVKPITAAKNQDESSHIASKLIKKVS